MTDSLTTINLNKKTLILYILLSFNAFSTNRYTIRLIYVINTGPEEPDEKKNGTWAEGAGKILPKIHKLTTSNCCKKNEKVYNLYNIRNNFVTKKLNHLIKLQSAIKWDYNTFEKRLQNVFTIWMSFLRWPTSATAKQKVTAKHISTRGTTK